MAATPRGRPRCKSEAPLLHKLRLITDARTGLPMSHPVASTFWPDSQSSVTASGSAKCGSGQWSLRGRSLEEDCRPFPLASNAPCPLLADRGPLLQLGGTSNMGLVRGLSPFAAATRRRTEYAQDARCSTRVPSEAAGGWRISPQGGSQGCEPVWRQSMDGLSTNPGARPRTFRAGMPGKRVSGVAFSLVTFSWPRKRK